MPDRPAVCMIAVWVAAALAGCSSLSSDDAPPPEPKGNLLRNGSFEYWGQGGPLGWEIGQTGRIDPEGGAAHGHIAASLTCLLPDESVVLRQTVAAPEPGPLRASVRVRTIVPTAGGALRVDVLNEAGSRIGGASSEIRGQPGDWRVASCAIPCPKGTAAIRYEISLGPGASGQIVVDFARLERVEPPPPDAQPVLK